MRELLPASQDRILDILVRSARPRRLQEIAEAVDLAAPTVHKHLKRLEALGLVEKTRHPERKVSVYAPTASSLGHYVGPQRERGGWVRFAWNAAGPLDWRFPLVARVPDALARRVLSSFLHEATYRGLLTPTTMRPPKERPLDEPIHADLPSLTFVVYGSTARGEANPRSDIDLLGLVDQENTYDTEALEALANDLVFASDYPRDGPEPRPLDLRTMTWEKLFQTSASFIGPIAADAITVHSTAPRPRWLEAMETPGDGDGGA